MNNRNNIKLETKVLATLVVDPDRLIDCTEIIGASTFSFYEHQTTGVISTLFQNTPVTDSVDNELQRLGVKFKCTTSLVSLILAVLLPTNA